jgi:hypothetical protein
MVYGSPEEPMNMNLVVQIAESLAGAVVVTLAKVACGVDLANISLVPN